MSDAKANIDESRRRSTKAHEYLMEKSPAYRAFQDFAAQAFRPGVLGSSVKELIAIGISICVKCEPCTDYHVRQALHHGATEEQILEAIEVAMEMGGGPATVQARLALERLEIERAR